MIKLPKSFTAEFGKSLAASLLTELSTIVVEIEEEVSKKDAIFANVIFKQTFLIQIYLIASFICFLYFKTRPIYQMNANMLLLLRDGNLENVESLIIGNKASMAKVFPSFIVLLLHHYDTNYLSVSQLLEDIGYDPVQREEKLSFPMERLCVAILLYSFYTTGLLLTKFELQICSDDEYIGEFT